MTIRRRVRIVAEVERTQKRKVRVKSLLLGGMMREQG